MRSLCAFLVLLLAGAAAHAQMVMEGRVRDAGTGAPLPFASITRSDGRSALTNEDGVFRIPITGAGDTLTVAYLGYQHQRLPAGPAKDIALEPSTTELRAVTVDGKLDPIYALIVQCGRNLDRIGRYRSKLYYELGTRTGDRPVEALECFYNADLRGPDIETLALKNGRIAVVPDKGRYVMNLNTSKGFTLLHPTRKGPFPTSPLELASATALHKRYDATLLSITHDPEELYHVELVPRDTTADLFHAELWIEPATARIRSLELTCTRCRSHPFQALYPDAELRDMDIRYKQTYARVQDRFRLSTIELDYTLIYHARSASRDPEVQRDRRMYAKGVMHLFDHGKSFILPFFGYDRDQTDYRKITFMPYDSAFWANAPTLPRTAQQERDLALFHAEGTLLGHGRQLVPGHKSSLFESNYAFWSPVRRISIKSGLLPTAAVNGAPPQAAVPVAARVGLVAQIYLNIDSTASGYRTFSATVFDGARSFHHLPEGPYTDLFLNLYFDLCEVERRKMQAALDMPGATLERIQAIHHGAEAEMQRTTQRYMKEVEHGANAAGLQRWSDRVRNELGIDNLALFGLVRKP